MIQYPCVLLGRANPCVLLGLWGALPQGPFWQVVTALLLAILEVVPPIVLTTEAASLPKRRSSWLSPIPPVPPKEFLLTSDSFVPRVFLSMFFSFHVFGFLAGS